MRIHGFWKDLERMDQRRADETLLEERHVEETHTSMWEHRAMFGNEEADAEIGISTSLRESGTVLELPTVGNGVWSA